ncbi:penicillin-binding transpeptidase domain-containing protein [Parasporobacterium paucivorans]|uniref:Penicillin-binding protein 2 n=1 Tax=Parasporobacterium paucivorans DSM 15970 TaxID=1122934 RepID=A0A1M6A2S8_9FIRM|nr:penicillin-binding transpeptidase domain-containing protein [Parasporobacterium paucivorans]SHI30755.1 penicillin-binding protein 2 [Parasporobacterium paucivorans DSM 15970]
MIENIRERIQKLIKSREFIICGICFILFFFLVIRIFDLQIVKKDYYLNNYIQKAQKTIYSSGTRGNIYDRNGNILAYNKLAYSVTMEDLVESGNTKNNELNSIIYTAISLIETNGDTLDGSFPIILDSAGKPEFSFASDSARNTFLINVYGLSSKEDIATKGLSDASALEVFTYMCGKDKYELGDEYSTDMKLKILTVRYNLSLNSYQKYITTTIASDVSDKTVAAIYENSTKLTGVTISEGSIRVYDESSCFSHILGYTGLISDEQLQELNAAGGDYVSGDMVGKSGIEEVMDTYLQGKRGEETVFVNSLGSIIESVSKTNPEAGNDVYLTIDKNLQIASYNILEQKLAGILYSKIKNGDVQNTANSTMNIGIKEVYFQMINNNVLDLNSFSDDGATDNEKRVYSKFKGKFDSVQSYLSSQLYDQGQTTLSAMPEEYQTYVHYIFDLLKNDNILVEDNIDTKDETYVAWNNGSIGLSEFLSHAIAENWIDASNISPDSRYADSDQIYAALAEYILSNLSSDSGFSKKIYYYLIENGTISGNEICMLLFDQGVLAADEASYTSLASGNGGTAYNFMMEQIRLIHITPAQIALDPCSGSVTVTDPDNGNVLALVTYPGYDNNLLSGKVDAKYWNSLNNDLSLPLYNRATQSRMAPGSTFKMVSAVAGMESGVITPGTLIHDEGLFTKISPNAKCWKYPSSHGDVNVVGALSVSCNYFFYEVGYRLSLGQTGVYDSNQGLSVIKKYAEMLGLTSLSGVEILENDPLFSKTDAVRTAIGQGSNAYTGVQLARYVNTVANSGKNYSLTLLNKVVTPSGTVEKEFKPNLESTAAVSQSTWDAVHQGMRSVATTGTGAKTFKDFPIEVAAKSGTAQENALRSNHAVYVAYAPYSAPEMAMSVVIPYGDSSGYCAEVVRDIINFYFNGPGETSIEDGTASVPSSGIVGD